MSRKAFSANLTYNVIGALLPLATSLGTVPFYIHEIGLARYGVVTITWVLLGYFGFLDFGLSRASANALARLGPASASERSPVLVTAFCCNFGLGLIGGFILYFVGHIILLHVVKVPGSLMGETRAAYPWMAAMLPLGMLSGVATGALESRERFLLSNTLTSFGTMAGQILPLAAAYAFGPSLEVVIPATLLSRLLTVAIAYLVVIRLEWPVHFLDFRVSWARKLFGYGSWVSVSSILNPLLDTSNQLIVGAMLGAAAVANYSIPMTLAMRSQVFATALSRTLFPRSSRASQEEASEITRNATIALAYGFGMVCGPAIFLCGPFLRLWIGHRFAAPSEAVGQIVMFGAWTNGVAFIPYGFIQARGRPHVTAKVGLVEILPFFLVLWLLLSTMGLPGAAWAWSLRVTLNCGALLVLSGCFDRETWRLFPALVLMCLALAIVQVVPMTAVIAFAFAVPFGIAFAVLGYSLDPVLRNVVLGLARRVGIVAPQAAISQRDPV
ncbi:MAG TPA: flippase [Acidisoma sp.]|uniref:flippase n=1 Tax=Acidisoma sp. TaxID=1872115 RepID=UPI002D12A5CC|nr:flippase [Acidisoma sp.]HTI02382.1 flippase [Acidisoma sp.]